MASDKNGDRDYSKIGYHGRPITELNREELMAAIGELIDILSEYKRKNAKCMEILGKEKFDSL